MVLKTITISLPIDRYNYLIDNLKIINYSTIDGDANNILLGWIAILLLIEDVAGINMAFDIKYGRLNFKYEDKEMNFIIPNNKYGCLSAYIILICNNDEPISFEEALEYLYNDNN